MAELISRIYSNFRGVDFRGEEINLVRSPDSLNMWKDYKKTESIRTRPGLELYQGFADPIYGIFEYDGGIIVHSGTHLYHSDLGFDEENAFFSEANLAPSVGFVFEDAFYFVDGKNYLKYINGIYAGEVEGYIPTTSISRSPMGGGKTFEDVNMLSDYRKNSFRADGASFSYYLDTMNIDEDFTPVVYVNDELAWIYVDGEDIGENEYAYKVYYAEGKIEFVKNPPKKPRTDGQDNIVVEFKKALVNEKGVKKYQETILGCTMAQVFDNRVFFSGNPKYPNTVWHCGLNDPSYVSDLDYYHEGMDEARITGMVAGNNALWVFRAPTSSGTAIFYHTPSIDDEYGKVYPSVHSSVTTGCIGKAINFSDDIVFFSSRGMEGISGDVTTEQVVAHRSSLVDRKMAPKTAEEYNAYRNMVLAEWEGYLFVFIGNKAYLADSRAMFTNEDHNEYEWFYWELEKNVTCATVKNCVLYIGTDDGVYTFTDLTANVESYWVTPKDKFKYPQKLKTSNKRGCVAEATGDITVYAKVEDTDFEEIGTYENVTDYFVSRIKRKKWKDIQLKYHSKTRFSLETCTLEAWVGGYIKR